MMLAEISRLRMVAIKHLKRGITLNSITDFLGIVISPDKLLSLNFFRHPRGSFLVLKLEFLELFPK
jgi:hypothetical protein